MRILPVVCGPHFRRVCPVALSRGLQRQVPFGTRLLSAVGGGPTAEGAHCDGAVAPAVHGSVRVTLGPPGAGADDRKVERFSWHVRRTLGLGEVVELNARGPRAVMNALRAMASGDHRTEFETTWSGEGGTRYLRFVARVGTVPDGFASQRIGSMSSALVATGKSTVLQLARALSLEEGKKGFAFVAAREDDEVALNILAKALATAPSTGRECKRFQCFPEFTGSPGSTRLLVYLCGAPAQLPERSGATFTAVPPGVGADRSYTLRFVTATHDRLRRGDDVQMECRGPDAVWHSLRALSELPGHTTEVEVSWCRRPAKAGPNVRAEVATESTSEVKPQVGTDDRRGVDGSDGQRVLNVIALRARRGESYKEFNSTVFAETRRLLVASTTDVRTLAWAIVKEVRRRKAVAVHAYGNDRASVNIAVKALATVPRLTDGSRLSFVPSLGSSKGPGKQVLRLYVQKVQQSASK